MKRRILEENVLYDIGRHLSIYDDARIDILTELCGSLKNYKSAGLGLCHIKGCGADIGNDRIELRFVLLLIARGDLLYTGDDGVVSNLFKCRTKLGLENDDYRNNSDLIEILQNEIDRPHIDCIAYYHNKDYEQKSKRELTGSPVFYKTVNVKQEQRKKKDIDNVNNTVNAKDNVYHIVLEERTNVSKKFADIHANHPQ